MKEGAAKPLPGERKGFWTRPSTVVGGLTIAVVTAGLAGLYYVQRSVPAVPPTTAAPVPAAQSQSAGSRPAVSGDDAPVLVRFSLDNSYPDSELPLVDAALQVLPAREVAVAAPTAIPDLIRTHFAISAGSQGGLYARLEAEIRRRSEIINGLVAPGTARVPQLPPLTAARNNLAAFISVRMGRDRSDSALLILPTGEPFRPASPTQPSLTTYVVRATERDLQQAPLQTLAFSPRGTVLAKQFLVTLANRTAPVGPPYPSYVLNDAALLQSALATGHRRAKLYIVDTGWPDASEWRASTAALSQLCADARAWYHFPPMPSPITTSGSLQAAKDSHVGNVKASLTQVATLSNQVEIIYLPMTLDQQSEPLLREIIRLGFAIDLVGRSETKEGRPEESVGRNKYSQVKDDWVNDAISAIAASAKDGKLHANSALLRGLFLVAAQDAAASGDGYFVNESWTTDDGVMIGQKLLAPRGFVIAAVGNEDPRNITTVPILAFAGLSRTNNDILAVLTMDARGNPACNTSVVTFEQDDLGLGAVGYLGQISSTQCFSSFAAPRVAWFLAARETLREAPISSSDRWISQTRLRLNRLRADTDPLPQSLLFDPLRYIMGK